MLDDVYFAATCPRCGYPVDIQLIDARLESQIHCPNCKVAIQLVDETATVHASENRVRAALDDLARSLGRL